MKLAIIGAGIAGLSCAHIAAQKGYQVTVFDKGRGAGGRLSTKRLNANEKEFRFDHGAPSFEVHSDGFRHALNEYLENGAITEFGSSRDGVCRLTGRPAMNSVVKAFAEGLDVRFSKRVTQVFKTENGWMLSFEGDDADLEFDIIVSAIPAEQAASLLAGCAPDIAQIALDVECAPVWVSMLGFDAPLDLDFMTLSPKSDTLSGIIRNQLKPGRDASHDCIVLHATTDWSKAHLEDAPEAVLAAMADAFWKETGLDAVTPSVEHAHRWRYAFTTKPVGKPFLQSHEGSLSVCGDWLIGAAVEEAWQSGTALGEALTDLR